MNLPPLDPLSASDEEMGVTMVRTQQASSPNWDFVICRTALWTVSCDYLLGPWLTWTVEENKESLEGGRG